MRIKLIFGLFVLVLVVTLVFSRTRTSEAPKVKVLTFDGKEKISFEVELARTKEERTRGLMFRKDLPEDQGMLFIFDQEKPHWFWMKNTLIPLDMIFIGQNGKIVGIVRQAAPEKEELLGGWKSRFVLEISGGLAEKYDIKEGDKVEFENLSLN